MAINTNMSAQSSARPLVESSQLLSNNLARLSFGSKIVTPEDDVAGQAVSTRFDAAISRIDATRGNIANAISFIQTQDGFLKKVAKALDHMGELAILSQDITKQDLDRALHRAEFSTLARYIQDLGTKDYNGVSLYDGTTLDVTIDSDDNKFSITGVDLIGSTSYTDALSASMTSMSEATAALSLVKTAISQVSAVVSSVRQPPRSASGRRFGARQAGGWRSEETGVH